MTIQEMIEMVESFKVGMRVDLDMISKLVRICKKQMDLIKGMWMPIEDASKTKDTVLGRNGKNVYCMRWCDEDEVSNWDGEKEFNPGWYEVSQHNDYDEYFYPVDPSHWAPLPEVFDE
jgi:hypothetical protein